jgi:hypothetical protein
VKAPSTAWSPSLEVAHGPDSVTMSSAELRNAWLHGLTSGTPMSASEPGGVGLELTWAAAVRRAPMLLLQRLNDDADAGDRHDDNDVAAIADQSGCAPMTSSGQLEASTHLPWGQAVLAGTADGLSGRGQGPWAPSLELKCWLVPAFKTAERALAIHMTWPCPNGHDLARTKGRPPCTQTRNCDSM